MILKFYIGYDVRDSCLDLSNYFQEHGKYGTFHYWKYDGYDNYEKLSRDTKTSFLKRMNK